MTSRHAGNRAVDDDKRLLYEIGDLLAEIPDTYEDLVRFAPVEAHLDGITQDMLVYLRERDELTSSAILDWMLEKSGWEHS